MILQVKVKPRSGTSGLERQPDGSWVARLKSLPVDGKANEELVALVAERFRCPKSSVSIRSGASGRLKIIKVDVKESPR